MQNVFYHPIIIDELRGAEKKYTIKTSANQNKYIAEILKISAIKNLFAEVFVRQQNNLIKVEGKINASLELESVISLKLFEKKYSISFGVVYDKSLNYQMQREIENQGGDAPDIIVGGKIDLADVIIEQIALNLDEYPKMDGEVFEF